MDDHLTYVACCTIPILVKTPGLINNRNLQNDYNMEISFHECKIGHISHGFVFAERKIWQSLRICKKSWKIHEN